MNPAAGLRLRGVSRRYGEHTAVQALDLDIPAGAFVALLGPSGCGKTTLLRMIAGFEPLDAGEIHLDGEPLAQVGGQVPPEQRHMGMVFQSYALWPHLSVADNVGYPLKLRGVRGADYQRRVHEALALVQLDTRAQAMPQDLSGGQRQRVALARCLIAEPRVVLLDEPLANLDRHLRAAMETSFRDFHRRTGATFVYVTHDQGEAMALADHVAVLHQGRLVQWATPPALYARPRTDWLAGFIGQGSVLRQAQDVAQQALGGDRLHRLLGVQPVRAAEAYPVLVRPEHVRLALQGSGADEADALPGRVHECVFKGERYEIRLALADGQALVAYHAQPIAVGTPVAVRITQGWGLSRAD
ncbi:MAG: Spermidine/putrescine import ATP-binding protein PotA [Paracidovorax wautersii]|uniref:Spermidine/putrescine import ATP-binding protein PotA n=1 Tax=Paracidovorax wautersii TaxID=1177982 RepID=A0A7V8FRT5_9BURK|nr:MAG: Spermidine/putrescine import ATP-binding protein PotA [Paracidovorax wautersii]